MRGKRRVDRRCGVQPPKLRGRPCCDPVLLWQVAGSQPRRAAVHQWRRGPSRPNRVSSNPNASTEPTPTKSAVNSPSRQASTALLIVCQSQPNSAATSDTPRASRQVSWVPLLGGGSSRLALVGRGWSYRPRRGLRLARDGCVLDQLSCSQAVVLSSALIWPRLELPPAPSALVSPRMALVGPAVALWSLWSPQNQSLMHSVYPNPHPYSDSPRLAEFWVSPGGR